MGVRGFPHRFLISTGLWEPEDRPARLWERGAVDSGSYPVPHTLPTSEVRVLRSNRSTSSQCTSKDVMFSFFIVSGISSRRVLKVLIHTGIMASPSWTIIISSWLASWWCCCPSCSIFSDFDASIAEPAWTEVLPSSGWKRDWARRTFRSACEVYSRKSGSMAVRNSSQVLFVLMIGGILIVNGLLIVDSPVGGILFPGA